MPMPINPEHTGTEIRVFIPDTWTREEKDWMETRIVGIAHEARQRQLECIVTAIDHADYQLETYEASANARPLFD